MEIIIMAIAMCLSIISLVINIEVRRQNRLFEAQTIAEHERLKKEFDIQVREKNKIRAELDMLKTKTKH